MIKRTSYLVILFLAFGGALSLWAGDSATFTDLGFSPDGKVYFFGQYGINGGTLKPWAELYGVDVAKNNFVSGGRLAYTHDSPIIPGQDGSGALYRLISGNAALTGRYGIDFLRQGPSLYLSLENGTPLETPVKNGEDSTDKMAQESIAFRDFTQGSSYSATLVSQIHETASGAQASFSIDLERTAKDGSKKTYKVGNPQIRRPIISYMIRRVILAPQENALVFVIEMNKTSASGSDIRYMVETLEL